MREEPERPMRGPYERSLRGTIERAVKSPMRGAWNFLRGAYENPGGSL
jgi:hypothetical protein